MDFDKEAFNAMLQTDEGKALVEEQKAGLVNKKDELLGKLAKANESLNAYKDLGDPEELKNILQNVREAKQKEIDSDAEAKEQYLNEQLEKAKTDYSQLQQTLIKDKVSNTILEAVAKAKGDADILVPLLSQRVNGELVDGRVNVNVYEEGKVAHKDGERMSVADLVDDMKVKHPNLFEVSASGTGTKPGQTTNASVNTYDFKSDNFNLTKAAERNKKNSSYESVTRKFGWRS